MVDYEQFKEAIKIIAVQQIIMGDKIYSNFFKSATTLEKIEWVASAYPVFKKILPNLDKLEFYILSKKYEQEILGFVHSTYWDILTEYY